MSPIRIAHRHLGSEGIDDIKRMQSLAASLGASFAEREMPVINLHIGQPAFRPAPDVFETYARIMEREHVGYSPMSGFGQTRTILQEHAAGWLPHITSTQHVAFQDGGCHALDNIMRVLCDPGDEVITADPMWAVYRTNARNAGATVVPVAYYANGEIDTDLLAHAITPRTRAMVITSPDNPTGQMLRREHLHDLATFVERHPQIAVIEDCVYRDLAYAHPQDTITRFIPDRTIVVDSFSKKCAATGVRAGAVYAPPHIIKTLEEVDRGAMGAPSTLAQYFVWALFQEKSVPLPGMVEELHKRRDATLEELAIMRGYGWTHPPLDGAFYAFPDVGEPSRAFAEQLVHETGVSVVPGAGFGPAGANAIRISYGSADAETIREAFRRIRVFLDDGL